MLLQEQKPHNIDIPVLFGKKFFKILRINAGPVFRKQLVVKEKIDDPSKMLVPTEWNKGGVGLQAGLGVDIWKIGIDIRYDGEFTKLVSNKNIHSNVYQFTLAYQLK